MAFLKSSENVVLGIDIDIDTRSHFFKVSISKINIDTLYRYHESDPIHESIFIFDIDIKN